MGRLVAITDTCYECHGPADIFSVPDNMDLVEEMSLYEKWYHDEYQNPDVQTSGYISFGDWIVSRGAIKNPPDVKFVDESELRHLATRRWTYERPKSDFEKAMDAMFVETVMNYAVHPLTGISSGEMKRIAWHRFGS